MDELLKSPTKQSVESSEMVLKSGFHTTTSSFIRRTAFPSTLLIHLIEGRMIFAKQNLFQSYKASFCKQASGQLHDQSTEQLVALTVAITHKLGATISSDEWSNAQCRPIRWCSFAKPQQLRTLGHDMFAFTHTGRRRGGDSRMCIAKGPGPRQARGAEALLSARGARRRGSAPRPTLSGIVGLPARGP